MNKACNVLLLSLFFAFCAEAQTTSPALNKKDAVTANGSLTPVYQSWNPQANSPVMINPNPGKPIRTINIFINLNYSHLMEEFGPEGTVTPGLFTEPMSQNVYAPKEWPWPNTHAPRSQVNNKSTRPRYLKNWMDAEYTTPEKVYGVYTRLFCQSSFGSLIVLGDHVWVDVRVEDIAPKSQFHEISSVSSIISTAIKIINDNGGLTVIGGYHNLREYDQNGDNKIDFTQVFIRNSGKVTFSDNSVHTYGELNNGQGYGGYSVSGLKIEGIVCNSQTGTVQCLGDGDFSLFPKSTATHEFSHCLFGGNNFHASGGNHYGIGDVCTTFSLQGGYGLMGGAWSSLLSCNGYERLRMHWKSPENTTSFYVSALDTGTRKIICSDISKADGHKTFLLRDFVKYGDAVRIKLPYKDNATSSNQYLWLENHSIDIFNPAHFPFFWIDYLDYSNKDAFRPKGVPGIYAYIQVGKDSLESKSMSAVWPADETDNLFPVSAEGNWDYEAVPLENHIWGQNKPAERLDLGRPNPLSGYNDMQTHFVRDLKGYNGTLNKDKGEMMWIKYKGNSRVDYIPHKGDNEDAFCPSTRLIMDISSNPAPVNVVTCYSTIMNGKLKEVTTTRNTRSVYLSGLRIQMTPVPGSRDYWVDVSWDDYNVRNNVRWTGDIVLNEKLFLQSGCKIDLDQNYSPNQLKRDPRSSEYAAPTAFACRKNSYIQLKSNSQFVLNNKSSLVLNPESTFEMDDLSELKVKSGCTLRVEDCAKLIIKGKGVLTVEPGATLYISKKALLLFENGASCLNIQPGAVMENGSADPLEMVPPATRITSSLKWQGKEYLIYREIVIEPGAVLDLSNTRLRFYCDDSRVTLLDNGKLNLGNNSLITRIQQCGILKTMPGVEIIGGDQQPSK